MKDGTVTPANASKINDGACSIGMGCIFYYMYR